MNSRAISAVALLGITLLCGWYAKPAPPAEARGQVKETSTPDNKDSSVIELGNRSEIAAGETAAAEFAKHHDEHSSDQKTWPSLQRFGLVLHYPPDWQVNPKVPAVGPIALNTFQSHYSQRGGHFPKEGAEIDVSIWRHPKGTLKQIMTDDLKDSDDQKIDEVPLIVGGAKALRASYTDTFRGYLAHQTVAVYVEHGSALYKFFLTYHTGASFGAQFIADFNDILKQVRFT